MIRQKPVAGICALFCVCPLFGFLPADFAAFFRFSAQFQHEKLKWNLKFFSVTDRLGGPTFVWACHVRLISHLGLKSWQVFWKIFETFLRCLWRKNWKLKVKVAYIFLESDGRKIESDSRIKIIVDHLRSLKCLKSFFSCSIPFSFPLVASNFSAIDGDLIWSSSFSYAFFHFFSFSFCWIFFLSKTSQVVSFFFL